MKLLIVFIFMISCSLCCAKTPETAGILHPDKSISTCLAPFNGPLSQYSEPALVITAGDGWIKISSDGKIVFENVTPDKAAQEFWEKVTAAFPQFKEKILREAAE